MGMSDNAENDHRVGQVPISWMVHLSDCTIGVQFDSEDHADDYERITLWGIRGFSSCLYPSKVVAEMAARRLYPRMLPDERYSRIFYKTFAR